MNLANADKFHISQFHVTDGGPYVCDECFPAPAFEGASPVPMKWWLPSPPYDGMEMSIRAHENLTHHKVRHQ